MTATVDGPAAAQFRPLRLSGGLRVADLASNRAVSKPMRAAAAHAPSGDCVGWGIPFHIGRARLLKRDPATLKLGPVKAGWLVFLHTSDVRPLGSDESGFPKTRSGYGRLGELAARYVVIYADGSEEAFPIRRRHEIAAFQRAWGENCFQAVAQSKPRPVPAPHEQPAGDWGMGQTRVQSADGGRWVNWLCAWRNPHPRKEIVGVRLEPVSGVIILSAISAGEASAHPLRWQTRQKAVLRLPGRRGAPPRMDPANLLKQIRLDMGQVISASQRPIYPDREWGRTYSNRLPEMAEREALVEYTAHPDASFHLPGGKVIPVRSLARAGRAGPLVRVPAATQRVTVRVVEAGSGRAVPVRLHLHGQAGEYLPPVDRHRIPNPAWFEDYSVDFAHAEVHYSAYIPGETSVDLPLGKVYLEVSKGLEIRPIRRTYPVTRGTREIVVTLDKVLDWRERGWVSADTHVHFLSPTSALLEGSAEGVNVVNLLASQWGELMTNVGDFDGKTTWGSREAGGDGEHLVRVGTENRQHVLGHISLLGYEGRIIAPMTTGGPDESALGDSVECLLTEWARQCRERNGVVVVPHFPNPRAEAAAGLISGDVDAVEMTSWGDLYAGISAYSLADWYRYLNNGYLVAAVGGTDKMSATTPVGAIRTYARLEANQPFSYDAWKESVRAARTFVTYGPLMEFSVEGLGPGCRLRMDRSGGTVGVHWRVASVTVPMSRVELVVNGEIRESRKVAPGRDEGQWSVALDRSSWLALLVRGGHRDKPEVIAAHSSPVMVEVEGSPFLAAADAVSILEQIEGVLAYLETIGTRADERARKRMRLVLTSAHRSLHNRLHQQGHYHHHTPTEDHSEHHH